MKNIYYLLWVDAIINANEYKNKQSGWQMSLLWFLTTMNVFNAMAILFWLDYFQLYRHEFLIDFKVQSLGFRLLEAFLNAFLPFAILNYFLIFHNKRYKKLLGKYPNYNGKLALFYSLGSIFLIVLTVILLW